uniref:bL28m n=1 Tax=Polytomella magna TaxID=353565 RepID=UPI002240E3D8|nr:Chain Av, bL28m [Polytomella magna]8APN_Av Chain Av, bL28m [Polytomella magna]8APO_Av Chain Av, bL28m [Polytomella magna]
QQKNVEIARKLLPLAKKQLKGLLDRQDNVLWGKTDIVIRKRTFKKNDEELYSLVQVQWLDVKLWSNILQERVPLTLSQETLTHIESIGGLDDYLLKTPDSQMKSNFSSDLRWRVVCEAMKQGEAESKQK